MHKLEEDVTETVGVNGRRLILMEIHTFGVKTQDVMHALGLWSKMNNLSINAISVEGKQIFISLNFQNSLQS